MGGRAEYPGVDMESVEYADEITPAIATWLGWQAARKGREDEGRDLIPESMEPSYDAGRALPDDMSVVCPAPETLKRKLLRRLGGEPDRKRKVKPLDVKIVGMVKRPDVGTATRYNVTIQKGDRAATLRDLCASDLLTWSRLRPIAMDAGMVLHNLERGQAVKWLEAVEAALEKAVVVPLAPEESEAGEIIDLISDIISSARPWEWSEDDQHPRGIALVVHDGVKGWTRGPIQDVLRAKLGRVSRVALSRSVRHLGLARADWRIGSSYIRVWAETPRDDGGEA